MPEPQYVRRSYAGGDAVAQLVQEIGSTDISFTITPTTGWVEEDGSPLGTSGPFTVGIDRFTPQLEKILCGSINLTTGVVTVFVDTDGWSGRGYDGTTAQSHVPDGSTSGVQTCWSAAEANEANQAVFDLLGGGGASLVGVPIGTSIDFRGTTRTVPTNFLWENAAAVSRAAYSALFTAITVAATGNTTAGGATITNVPTTVTAVLAAGMQVTGANLGASGTIYTIQSVTATTIVLTSGTGVVPGTAGSLVIYPHGAGDGLTTFNLPDSRGKVTGGFGTLGTNTSPTLFVGISGGEWKHALSQAELPTTIGTAAAQAATVTQGYVSIAGTSFIVGLATGQNNSINITGGGTSGPAGVSSTPGGAGGSITTVGVAVANAASAVTNGGGGTSHNNMQPYSVATKCIRAL